MTRERRYLLIVLALASAAGGLVLGVKSVRGYHLLLSRQGTIIEQHRQASRLLVKSAMVVEGYRPAPYDYWSRTRKEPHLFFVGHIYPKNGFDGGQKTGFVNQEDPLDYITQRASRSSPGRVIFGGDNISSPTDAQLNHLLQISSRISFARFLLGNHEEYWTDLRARKEVFDVLFRARHWYEDVNGVRLVYLHTVTESGAHGLDQAQRAWLASSLDGEDYRYALVFLHHGLWAGESRYVNQDYPDADSLKSDWLYAVLPVLVKGRVRGVFAGDGGVRSSGRRFDRWGPLREG